MKTTEQIYQESIAWLFQQAPNYQIEGKKAYKPGLGNIQKLCDFFGNPEKKIKTIHIGGTNGKGSSSNMLASVLGQAGYRVGVYNSPHLIDFTERIKIGAVYVSKDFVIRFVEKLRDLPTDILPSFFEFTTIMCFQYFYEQKVDVAIIEVGLGGRLDSTNIIRPLVCAITNVDMDHMDILGDTIEKIASEKAGIIKSGVPIVCGDENPLVQEIVKQKALQENAPYLDATKYDATYGSDLKGDYQKKNQKVVLAVLDSLASLGFVVSEEDTEQGLLNVARNTRFMGRWHVVETSPLTICDTGHNQAGLTEVFGQLEKFKQPKHIVLGFVEDKKIEEVLQLLPKQEKYYFVKPAIQRGRSVSDYEFLLRQNGLNFLSFNSVEQGVEAALQNASASDLVFVGGSNFVVGEFLQKKFGT